MACVASKRPVAKSAPGFIVPTTMMASGHTTRRRFAPLFLNEMADLFAWRGRWFLARRRDVRVFFSTSRLIRP